jgi:hypothetical protein
MEIAELENLGVELCRSLLKRDYISVAQRLGYAIAFETIPAAAIKADFERSILESGGMLEHSKFSVTVKSFPSGTPGFINLIECRFIFANSNKEVLATAVPLTSNQ